MSDRKRLIELIQDAVGGCSTYEKRYPEVRQLGYKKLPRK